MLEFIEIHKLDPDIQWLEVKVGDQQHDEPAIIRLQVGDSEEMTTSFIKRFKAKREHECQVQDAQIATLNEYFAEACMAKVLKEKNNNHTDLIELLPTSVIHFRYPEHTSFRKSRAARIKLFEDEAFRAMEQRRFAFALARLNWIHFLDPVNEMAFELKVVCLRSWKKMAECVKVFEEWVSRAPDRIEPLLGLSEMWLHLEQNQKAKEYFTKVLAMQANHCMGLVGLAQAKLKLGESPINELRKAWMLDQGYTVRMLEQSFDFRRTNPDDLKPYTLSDIAKRYKIPLKRVLERAARGVLPAHPPDSEGLLRFSQKDLDQHYNILSSLGLELRSANLESYAAPSKDEPVSSQHAGNSPAQPSLFEDEEIHQEAPGDKK